MVGICPRSPRDVGLEQNKPFCHAGKPRAGDATQGRFSDLNRPPSSSVAVVQLLLVTIWRKPSMPLCMIDHICGRFATRRASAVMSWSSRLRAVCIRFGPAVKRPTNRWSEPPRPPMGALLRMPPCARNSAASAGAARDHAVGWATIPEIRAHAWRLPPSLAVRMDGMAATAPLLSTCEINVTRDVLATRSCCATQCGR